MLKTAIVLNPVYVTLFWVLIFLLTLRSGKKPGRILFIFMLAAFVLYSSHALYFSGFMLAYSYIDGLYLFCSLSVYPLFYFYVRYLTTKSGVPPVQLLHLIVPVLFAVVQYSLYSGLSHADRLDYFLMVKDDPTLIRGRFFLLYLNSRIARYVFAVQVVIYISLSLKLLKKQRQQVAEMFSNEERYGLGWVRTITLFMILMALTSFSLALAGRETFARHEGWLLIPSVLISLLLFGIGYIGHIQLRKTELISPIIDREERRTAPVTAVDGLRSKFNVYFESHKPYLDKDLKIWDVSRELGSNRTYISRIINEEYGMNFTSFVNRFRIEEAKRLIKEDTKSRLTYEHIAEMSGFGSINSLIRAFKEFESVTPGQYRLKIGSQGKKT